MSDVEFQEVMLKIINRYKELSYLWNRKDPIHKNKDMKEKGFSILLEIYQSIDPTFTIKCIKKKIENIVYNYRREAKKVSAAKKAGTEYVPTLWYYDAISFLPAVSDSNYGKSKKCLIQDETPAISYVEEDFSSQTILDEAATAVLGILDKEEQVWMSETVMENDVLDPTADQPAMKDIECEIYGKAIGLQLKELNTRSLALCQKLISDAIYYAKIGRLNEASYIGLTD